MLKANKSKWFEKIFTIYNRNLIRRKFHAIKVYNLENLQKKNFAPPLITYANHSSWWDGLILFELFSHFDFENYILMEEKQLRNLPLFRKLGAFSIVKEKPREALESINYAVQKLEENANANLWIFPQGEILPNRVRPLVFYNGMSKIIEKCGNCGVVPISIKLEFIKEFKPEIFLKIGKPQNFTNISKKKVKMLTKSFGQEMENLLNELETDIINNNLKNYRDLI